VVEDHRRSLTLLETEVLQITSERNIALALFQAQAAHSNVSVASSETQNTASALQSQTQIRHLKAELLALRQHITTLGVSSQELQDSLETANDIIDQHNMQDNQAPDCSDTPPSAVTIPNPVRLGDVTLEAIKELSALRSQVTRIDGLPDDMSNVSWPRITRDILGMENFHNLETLSAKRLCFVLQKEHMVL
jgi:Leucine-rich repeat (LRR) protein